MYNINMEVVMKKKVAKKSKGKLVQAIVLCGTIFGALNGAMNFFEGIPKVASQVSVALYGPPVTYGEIESLRIKPLW